MFRKVSMLGLAKWNAPSAEATFNGVLTESSPSLNFLLLTGEGDFVIM